jgi:hypothetical protein
VIRAVLLVLFAVIVGCAAGAGFLLIVLYPAA